MKKYFQINIKVIILFSSLLFSKSIQAQKTKTPDTKRGIIYVGTSVLQFFPSAVTLLKGAEDNSLYFINGNIEYHFVNINLSVGINAFYKNSVTDELNEDLAFSKFREEADGIYESYYIGIPINLYLSKYDNNPKNLCYFSLQPFHRFNESGKYTSSTKFLIGNTDDSYNYINSVRKRVADIYGMKIMLGGKSIVYNKQKIDLYIDISAGFSHRRKNLEIFTYEISTTSDLSKNVPTHIKYDEPVKSSRISSWYSPQFEIKVGVLIKH